MTGDTNTLSFQHMVGIPAKTIGYLMLTSLEVSGFRCFNHLKLEGLKRVNVITGANASGKSALLEALYLGAHANAVALQNVLAGRSQMLASAPFLIGTGVGMPMPVQPSVLDINLDDLFRSATVTSFQDQSESIEKAAKIEISYTDNSQLIRKLTMSYQSIGEGTPTPVIRRPGGISAPPQVILLRELKSSGGATEHAAVPVTVNQFGQLQQTPVAPFGPATMIFGPNMDYAEVDDVTWFSQLKQRNEADTVISFLKEEFPFIKDIEVLAPRGVNGLFALVSGGDWRRIASISSGIYKIISILLACAHTRNGVILIDEIENGLYYEKYEAVWRILYRFARQTENQIFVSSHSTECLQCLAPILTENDADDFCLLRAERLSDECVVRYASGTSMRAALKRDGELRGATIVTKEPVY